MKPEQFLSLYQKSKLEVFTVHLDPKTRGPTRDPNGFRSKTSTSATDTGRVRY